METSNTDGNAIKFSIENTKTLLSNQLTGKTIYWLGSSVTYGSASGQITMAEYIAKRNGATCVEEAMSGTTLYSTPQNSFDVSYSVRLESTNKFNKQAKVDAFVCQISTNDVSSIEGVNKLGNVTADDKRELTDFDRTTTLGAVEYIISYVKSTWNCPIVFYSGTEYGGETGYNYGKLVNEIKKLEAKWGITVLDLYHDSEMNNVSPEQYDYYMSDPIHPKLAGYYEWWTPKFEEALKKEMG